MACCDERTYSADMAVFGVAQVIRCAAGHFLGAMVGRVVGLAGVQPQTIDVYQAASDLKACEVVVKLGRTGRQIDLNRIDECGAVDADACRVGNDHIGALSRNFNRTLEQAGMNRIDLVQDDFGGSLCQPRVGLYPQGMA